jgi:hypothetical protein
VRWIALQQQGDRTSAALSAAAPSLDTSQAEGMTVTIVDAARPVTGGVDTHLDLNVAAALDAIGGLLAVAEFPATADGHRRLLGWLAGFGPVARVGVEGTGSYGAGLARFLRVAGVEVVEVDRPNRQARRRAGKSDPLDAIEAPGRCCPAGLAVRPSPGTGTWRRSGRWWWPSGLPGPPRSRPSARSAI